MDTKELIDQVRDDLGARKKWEDRQPVWYKMRHEGLRRTRKPHPHASDLHFPLADIIVEKLKPFYYQQLFAAELLGELVSEREQAESHADHAARWFDHQMKMKSNLLTQVLYVIDQFLMSGTSVCRVTYNPTRDRIEFLAIPPEKFIVPAATEELAEASRACHVEVIPVEVYKDRPGYRGDEDFLTRIRGRGTNQAGQHKDDERAEREGITHTDSNAMVVVWNVWKREGKAWTLHTVSPLVPDEPIRPPLRNPYAHGALPFVDFPRELTEPGFYSSRGEVEKAAPFESYLKRVWDMKSDSLGYYGTPLLTSDDPNAEAKSINAAPGQFIPRGVRRVDMGPPPFGLNEEMNHTRGIAEQRAAMPDFGVTEQGGSDKRTATEIEHIAQLGGMSTNLRAHIFRLSFQRLLRQAWHLCVQYRTKDLRYLWERMPTQAPREALHTAYHIDVGGTSESWNKKLEAQKVAALFDRARGDDYFDQLEIRKMLVEKTEPRWVKRLVRDPQIQANHEAEDEMVKIPAIMEGAPLAVHPQENHAVRAEVVFGKLEALGRHQTPLDPVAQQGLVSRLNQRMQVWTQVDPKAAKAWWRQKQEQLQAQAQAQANVVPFAPSGGQSFGQPGGQPGGMPAQPMPLPGGDQPLMAGGFAQ